MKLSTKLFEPKKSPKGSSSYDNPRENIDPQVKTKVVNAKEVISNSGHFTYNYVTNAYEDYAYINDLDIYYIEMNTVGTFKLPNYLYSPMVPGYLAYDYNNNRLMVYMSTDWEIVSTIPLP